MRLRLVTARLVVAAVFGATASRAPAATRDEVLSSAVLVADRLAAVKTLARGWEDAPYLVGALLLAEDLDRRAPGSGASLMARVGSVVDRGDAAISKGDDAGYAQAAMDLLRLASPGDAERRGALLHATDGPLAFARRALHVTPSDGPPAAPWWVEGGYGVRFWQDDFFTLPPWLAMRGAAREGLPADAEARDLAYEWIEAYVFDHRPSSADPRETSVPSLRERAGPLLWDPDLELFRHDLSSFGRTNYWGRGNGWVAFGLVRAARHLDTPYAGGRYAAVVDRTGLREILTRLAAALAARRTPDGGWGTDLLHRDRCPDAETSATGLITFMLARGVNEGWLDRSVYLPIALKAFALLQRRIDADGDVVRIQPPGTGPDCTVTTSDDPPVNVTYGVGALLLAASEIARLPDADLARLEEDAEQPVDDRPLGRTLLLAAPGTFRLDTLVLTNGGPEPVHAVVERRDGAGSPLAAPGGIDVPPGRSVFVPLSRAAPGNTGVDVITVRATGDLAVRGAPDASRDLSSVSRGRRPIHVQRQVARALPLHAALAGGESLDVREAAGGLYALGGVNPSPIEAAVEIDVVDAAGWPLRTLERVVPTQAAFFERLLVPAGATVRFRNSGGGAFVPIQYPGR